MLGAEIPRGASRKPFRGLQKSGSRKATRDRLDFRVISAVDDDDLEGKPAFLDIESLEAMSQLLCMSLAGNDDGDGRNVIWRVHDLGSAECTIALVRRRLQRKGKPEEAHRLQSPV
jgi:hypothetical protein